MRIEPLGDSALLIELGHAIDDATHSRVRAAFDVLSRQSSLLDVVPAYTTVAVHYDPMSFGGDDIPPYDAARDFVTAALADLHDGVTPHGRVIEIPVRYGGSDGPDLDHVARHARLTPAEVISLHTAPTYAVHMMGFTPGFPYLGGLPARLATPRRATPRNSVPPGSVGIAGSQTGIYPLDTPGGWQLIGRTDERLFRPELEPPTLLRIGDRVRFVDEGGE